MSFFTTGESVSCLTTTPTRHTRKLAQSRPSEWNPTSGVLGATPNPTKCAPQCMCSGVYFK